jgi:putative pyruvate formate lyase activating enzyme
MNYLATELSTDTYVNIMDQYHPTWRVTREEKYAEIRRRTGPDELQQAYRYASEAGLWRFDSRWRRRV